MTNAFTKQVLKAAGAEVCVYCGECSADVKRNNTPCKHERKRHRYKPFSAQEVSQIEQAEREGYAGW